MHEDPRLTPALEESTPRAQPTGIGRVGAPIWLGTLVVAGVAGLGIRLWIDRTWLGVPDSDEAVVGLMARHILDGQLTTFFWGQAYGGSQEALLAAPVFAVFGSSYAALRV